MSTRTERSPDPYGNFDTIVFEKDGNGNIMLIPDGPRLTRKLHGMRQVDLR